MIFDVVVVGGGGHVGLPLAIMLSSRGVNTAIYDISKSAVEGINAEKMPFWEPGAEKLLQVSIEAKKLIATTATAQWRSYLKSILQFDYR